MSGRVHLFMTAKQSQPFDELIESWGIKENKLAKSHVAQMGVELMVRLWRNQAFTEDQKKDICDVIEPPNAGHLWVYLRQVNVKYLFDIINHFELQSDFALCHLIITAVRWLRDDITAGKVSASDIEFMKTVVEPKTVYHN